jgi:uncharacterized repeat protein (TIGR03803 family)
MKAAFVALFAATAGCAFVQLVSAADAANIKEKVLYSFCGNENCTDGAVPTSSLIDVKGTLFGTTALGGVYNGGSGTVFAVDPKTGKESVVHSFCSQQQGYDCLDGDVPEAGLTEVNGTLYGTTTGGGDEGCEGRGCGTVFSLGPETGTETVLHNFGAAGDGAVPYAGVISVKGTLFGTTFDGGGSCDCGTVFSLDASTGTEVVLHSFGSGTDGQEPIAGVTYVKGTLYGTARAGGTYGAGAIFSVNPATGTETVLYSFCPQFGCPDGADPETGLIEANGMLYGTTDEGRSETYCNNTDNPPGCGTAFSFDPKTRTETVLYASCGQQDCTDGQYPEGNLIDVAGTLYGTTYFGGQPAGCSPMPGCGTVFSVSAKTGSESVLYSFGAGNGVDGLQPVSGLIAVKGKFYGTTASGGANYDGTVFALEKKHEAVREEGNKP